MPRAARKKSSTGIYHIVLRGINKQQIFEDDEVLTIKELKKRQLSIMQIERLTGISFGIIRKSTVSELPV